VYSCTLRNFNYYNILVLDKFLCPADVTLVNWMIAMCWLWSERINVLFEVRCRCVSSLSKFLICRRCDWCLGVLISAERLILVLLVSACQICSLENVSCIPLMSLHHEFHPDIYLHSQISLQYFCDIAVWYCFTSQLSSASILP
jgi:hypothetical protein